MVQKGGKMIGAILGVFYTNGLEWAIHRYLLHGLGRNKRSIWSFHWSIHHRNARKNGHTDPDYHHGIWQWDGRGKEVVSLLALALGHAPLLRRFPYFTLAVWASIYRYYLVHKRSHLDPQWTRENVPWHMDHHLGPDQHANWCVTAPWFDVIMGTRKPWVGTAQEKQPTVEPFQE